METIYTEKITPELCRTKKLVFRPKTEEEAAFIQRRLFELGCAWEQAGKTTSHLANCVDKGQIVQDGKLYYNTSRSDDYLLCTREQFGAGPFPAPPLSIDQAFMLDLFNKLSARIDTLSERVEALDSKISEVHRELFPTAEETKPGLKLNP